MPRASTESGSESSKLRQTFAGREGSTLQNESVALCAIVGPCARILVAQGVSTEWIWTYEKRTACTTDELHGNGRERLVRLRDALDERIGWPAVRRC